ncbi:type II toxin-antitoxin system HicA family toxin [Aeromonas dhakensis]|uniref:type II toxin-antitoxin system HicA family toxin n=1 Tax=Aeromonas dhakensis TaxID=196024 RepID=UPI00191EC874|nr:type II toxin-antitoxin system HicA family toxin [Aeromonas dhakensis]MBL0676626.1 type II toxin-antitoxin system HicA family toxin [Aeromonas dhakensis]HCT2507485.1 type II toxin-antitoxin system HicA family toxin [Aeromonas dhakensis]
MGTRDKLWDRLHSKPKDFTWQELTTLLKSLGFEAMNGSGSRRKFVHTKTKKLIILHEPHPEKTIKEYAIKEVIENLRGLGESHE